jgi:hypothetical protein
VEGLKDHLIQLVTEMRKFCNASTAAARSGKAVSEEMMHLRVTPGVICGHKHTF